MIMSSVIFLSLVFFSLSSGQIPPPTNTLYISQEIDWFNPQDNRTYKEKVLIYDKYWDKRNPNSPIFFYAGNEGPVGGFYNNTGFMFDNAPDFGALIVFGEHRYYGDSLPFGSHSFTNENLRYLTIELAVADYANLMTVLKGPQYYNIPNAPVVVFGGSYGGILAAACRIHYPSVFAMALASSAPVPQTLNTVSPLIYFQLVTEDYTNVDSRCPDIVRSGYQTLIDMGNDGKYQQITETFGLCSPVTDAYDVMYLELWARNGLLTMAQYDYPYAASFEGSLPAWPVNASCNILLENKNDPIAALALAAGLYYNASMDYTLDCFNITQEFVLCADQTGCGTGPAAISWDYQMCTEIVYGQDTNNVTDMFPPRIWELGNLTAYCINKYGVIPEPDWMQLWYPLDVGNAGSYIIWSNGLIDPWHGGGYLTSPGPDHMPVVIFPSAAHHLDLRSSNPADPATTTANRQVEVNYLQEWLKALEGEEFEPYKFVPKKLKK